MPKTVRTFNINEVQVNIGDFYLWRTRSLIVSYSDFLLCTLQYEYKWTIFVKFWFHATWFSFIAVIVVIIIIVLTRLKE